MVCLVAKSGVPWSDEASKEWGSQGEKRSSSERTTAGSQSCTQSLLSGSVLASAKKVCVCKRSANVSDGGGNTVQPELTLTRSLFSSQKSHHTTTQSPREHSAV